MSTSEAEVNAQIDEMLGYVPKEEREPVKKESPAKVEEDEVVKKETEEVAEELEESEEETDEEESEEEEEEVADEVSPTMLAMQKNMATMMGAITDLTTTIANQNKPEEEEPEELTVDVADFIKDEAHLEEVFKDSASINKFVGNIVNTAVREAVKRTPDIAAKEANRIRTTGNALDSFYDDNKELESYREVVYYKGQAMLKADPSLNNDPTRFATELASVSKKMLNITEEAPVKKKLEKVKGASGFAPAGSSRKGGKKTETELDKTMDGFYNLRFGHSGY